MSDKIRATVRWILGVDEAGQPKLTGDDLLFLSQASAAAFAVAVHTRFDEDPTTDEIKKFIAAISGTHVQAGALNPVLAEWSILSAFDKPVPLDDVPLAETITSQNLIAAGVVRELGLSGDALDQFIEDIVDLITNPDEEED